MRYEIKKQNSTKAERKFYELLKQLKVSFRHRWIINGREIDFVVNKYAIDIDGHKQDTEKNIMLIKSGYIPIHYENNEVKKLKLENVKYVFN